jgi:hypothetical protein
MSSAEEFAESCARQRWFADEGWVSLQVAVDILQLFAESAGYVDEIGQDEVQRIMAEAFMVAEDLSDDYASQLVMQWELDDPRDRWRWTGELPPVQRGAPITKTPYRTSQSTIDAFNFAARCGDPARIADWLRNHPDDLFFLVQTLEAA